MCYKTKKKKILMNSIVIRNVSVVNEGKIYIADVSIKNEIIDDISKTRIQGDFTQEIEGTDLHLIPGMIDDQVHFRDPGLTNKANI